MPSHRAQAHLPESSPRFSSTAAGSSGTAVLEAFRTPHEVRSHVEGDAGFGDLLAVGHPAGARGATPGAGRRGDAPRAIPAPENVPLYRSRAERRAAERAHTPPWGTPVVPATAEEFLASSARPEPSPVAAPAPAPVRSGTTPSVTGAHHVLPVVASGGRAGIDQHLFEDNARTAPQPVLPSRRELRGAAPAPAPRRGRAYRRTSAPNLPRAAGARPEPLASAPAPAGRPRASHVGIVGTLGIATIAVPMSGLLASPPEPSTAELPVVSMPAAPQFPGLAREVVPVDLLTVLPPTDLGSSVLPRSLARPRVMLVDRASRGNERSVLPGCDGRVQRTSASNGQLDGSDLCTLWSRKHRLRADAAVALAKLNIAYQRRFGHSLCLTDSYRTIGEQRRLKAIKPGLAATPGTSEHGWGMAVDLCDGVERGRSVQYRWMRANAGDYGWANPDWALPGGGGPYEPWHWEFVAGQ